MLLMPQSQLYLYLLVQYDSNNLWGIGSLKVHECIGCQNASFLLNRTVSVWPQPNRLAFKEKIVHHWYGDYEEVQYSCTGHQTCSYGRHWLFLVATAPYVEFAIGRKLHYMYTIYIIAACCVHRYTVGSKIMPIHVGHLWTVLSLYSTL